tara:strand:+ start:1093 stop:1524 length:432 start_codon:yes stop_codon:yes gene_type:complete
VVKTTIGWRENVELLDFDNSLIKAKMDTGARTSSLHATHISESESSGGKYITFRLKNIGDNTKYKFFKSELKEWRIVKNSGGDEEYRPVIKTKVRIGKKTMMIELTLTQRSRMSYDMLIGRTALRKKFLIDSGKSYSTKLVRK